MSSTTRVAAALFAVQLLPVAAEDLKLPKEVTPVMRAACESDVRRLCVSGHATVEGVKSCVMEKFFKLGRRCQVVLASAGFSP